MDQVEAGREQYEEKLMDLREVLKILNRYKWGVASIGIVSALVATLAVFSMTPIYRATAIVLIEAKSTKPIGAVDEVYDPGMGRADYYGTQVQILKSRELAERVVDRLNLVDHADFAPQQPGRLAVLLNWRGWLPFLPETPEVPMSEEERAARRKEQVVASFTRRLTVEFVAFTQLAKIHFDAKDPELAAQVANTLADVFIESALEGRLSVTQKTSGWLTERLGGIKEDLQRAEQALQAFREQEQLVNVGGERGLVETELSDNVQRLREARKTRAEMASTYAKIQQANNDPTRLEDVSVLLQDVLVEGSKTTLLQAQQQVKQLEQRYGPKHPEMIAARARLDEATNAYHRQLITAAMGVKAKYEVARENERQLSQFESSARTTIRGLDRKEYQLRALEREVETNRQLYDMFLTRFKETDLTGSYESLVARVIDAAIPPRVPFKPNKRKIVLMALVGGLLLGILLAAVSAALNDMIQTAEELEAATGTPILGVLPLLTGGQKKTLAYQLVQAPRSGFSEGVRSVRTGVLLSDIDAKRKRLVVTSAIPGEGKTTLAINLAVAHGQLEKVLLLEGDLRRPSIAVKCGIKERSPGLIEYLTESAAIESCIYRNQEANIDIMPLGRIPPNPAEILASGRFHNLIELLAARYDRIVIDSAPCHAASDTVLLAKNCDGLIFLIQSNATSKRAIRSAIKHLRQANIPLIGAVVNQVDLKRYGHNYGAYYQDYGYYA